MSRVDDNLRRRLGSAANRVQKAAALCVLVPNLQTNIFLYEHQPSIVTKRQRYLLSAPPNGNVRLHEAH